MRVTRDMIIDVTLDNLVMYGDCGGDRKKIILRKKNIYLFDKQIGSSRSLICKEIKET